VSTSSVDGLVSGLNTTQIISQLMQIEQQPQQRLINQRTSVNAQITAYQQINSRFATLQSAASKLTTADEWHSRTATSSSDQVSVTADPNVLTGSITFDVQQVAKAQSYVSHGTYSSTAQTVTSSSTLKITPTGGSAVTVNVGDGSLAAVVSGINGANIGVRASAVQVGASSYRLQLTSTTTGASSGFAITDGTDATNTTPLGQLDELVHGQDAKLLVGDVGSAGQYTVTSASNTIKDVLPGVTMTVKAPVNAVTVDVQRSSGVLVNDVQSMVDAANAVLNSIAAATAYDTKTQKGQALVGDSTVRALQSQVLDIVTEAVGGTANAAAAGLEVDKTGAITFDNAKFTTAYNKDPDAVAKLFRPGGTVTAKDPAYASLASKVSLLVADDQTQAGSYDVKVTQAASQASRQLSGTVTAGDQLVLTSNGKSATVTAQAGDDLDALAQRINDAAATNSLGLTARVESGNLVIRASAYGSAPIFGTTSTSATLTLGTFTAGKDVAGTINGIVATGVGQALEAPATNSVLHGLSLLVTATDADVTAAAAQVGANANLFGTFNYTPGVAQRMSSLSADAVRSGTGRLTSAIAGKQTLIDDLTAQITNWDTTLAAKQDQFKQQYATLETALGKLKDQSTWLAGQLGSLPSSSSSNG